MSRPALDKPARRQDQSVWPEPGVASVLGRVPGSHVDAQGNNRITPDGGFEDLVPDNIVALECPAGTCVITDGRILHSGGLRTADGWRLAQRAAYNRGHMRQQENPCACAPVSLCRKQDAPPLTGDARGADLFPPEFYDKCSPKLRALLGWESHYGFGMTDGRTPESPHCAVQVGELSLSRPEELKQEFSVLQPEDGWGRGFVALQHGGPAGAAATSKL